MEVFLLTILVTGFLVISTCNVLLCYTLYKSMKRTARPKAIEPDNWEAFDLYHRDEFETRGQQ